MFTSHEVLQGGEGWRLSQTTSGHGLRPSCLCSKISMKTQKGGVPRVWGLVNTRQAQSFIICPFFWALYYVVYNKRLFTININVSLSSVSTSNKLMEPEEGPRNL